MSMDKALDMGKTSATGSFHLLIGVAGSTIIMFIGTFILATLLPVADVGLIWHGPYSLIYNQLLQRLGRKLCHDPADCQFKGFWEEMQKSMTSSFQG